MKIWELEEGKIYKCNDCGKYKVKDKELWHVSSNNKWYVSDLTYNYIINTNFTEIKRKLDWDKVPSWTKAQARDEDTEEWKNVYFVEMAHVEEGEMVHPDAFYPYYATFCDEFTHTDWENGEYYKQIRLHGSVIPQED